jgi:hypothetical protein
MKRIYLLLVAGMIIFTGCQGQNNQGLYDGDAKYKVAESAGMVEVVNKTVKYNDFKITVEKVYNDITNFKIYYKQTNLDKKINFRLKFVDDIGNKYQNIEGNNEASYGVYSIGKLDTKSKELYMDVVVFKKEMNSDGSYTEKEIWKDRIILPVVFSDTYKSRIEINKEYDLRIEKDNIKIKRIAFGKTDSVIEYETEPSYIKVNKINVDDKVFENPLSSGSSGGDVWMCNAGFGPVEEPKSISVEFINKSGKVESINILIDNK